jgi:HEAT repeat protein
MKRGTTRLDAWQAAALLATLLATLLSISALGGLHSPPAGLASGAVRASIRPVQQPRPELRGIDSGALCAALEQLPDDESSLPSLVSALSPERNPTIRRCAAQRLAELDSVAAAAPLRRLVQDADLSGVALGGLARHRDRATLQLLEGLTLSGEQSVAALVAMAEAHVPGIAARISAALARSRDASEQARLAEALGETGEASAVDALIALTASPPLAPVAYLALGRIGGARVQKLLAEQLLNGSDVDISPAAQGLARMGGSEAHQLLEQAAHSNREALRLAAASALADIDTPDVRAFMLRELGGTGAEAALGYFADAVEPQAVPLLERLARDRRGNLPVLAVQALVNQGAPGRAAIARLLHDDPNDDAVQAIFDSARTVLSLRPTLRAAAIERLRAGATSRGSWFDYLAGDLSGEARDALVAAARELGSSSSAISALASRGDTASVASLDQLSRDPDPRVAKQARSELLHTADSRALPALVAALGSPEPETRQDAMIGLLEMNALEGQRALDAASGNSDPQVRASAPRLLVQFGPEHLQSRLEAMTKDSDPNVAAASLSALLTLDRERGEQILYGALAGAPASFPFKNLNAPDYSDILANFARTTDATSAAKLVASAPELGYAMGPALEELGARADLPEATRLKAQELSEGKGVMHKVRRSL